MVYFDGVHLTGIFARLFAQCISCNLKKFPGQKMRMSKSKHFDETKHEIMVHLETGTEDKSAIENLGLPNRHLKKNTI
jgi:hypothetical protein